MVTEGETKSRGSDRTVQDGTRLVIGSIADLLSEIHSWPWMETG